MQAKEYHEQVLTASKLEEITDIMMGENLAMLAYGYLSPQIQ